MKETLNVSLHVIFVQHLQEDEARNQDLTQSVTSGLWLSVICYWFCCCYCEAPLSCVATKNWHHCIVQLQHMLLCAVHSCRDLELSTV